LPDGGAAEWGVDMPSSQVNGISLWSETQGTSGPPVVLVHGSWTDHHSWDLVAPRLAATHTVLTYDRRGHGQSQRSSSQGSVGEDVADLAGLIEQADIAPANLVGSSFGASICLRLAAGRPDLIRSLVIHEPPLVGLIADDPTMAPILQAFAERMGGVVQRLGDGDMAGGARRFVDDVAFGPGGWDQLPIAVRETFVANAPTFLDEQRDPEALLFDLASLKGFDRPTLVTKGDTSPPMFSPIAERVADAVSTASRHTFRGAGHVPHMTHPDDYVQCVSAFIA
jgi:pimeloyl-ACP methyl ester carboxylesterase